jgi:hypothetical protein
VHTGWLATLDPHLTLVGLGLSGLLYAAGLWWLRRATAALVANAPPSWREHFADDYEEALGFRARDALRSQATLWTLAVWLPTFVLLTLVDVLLVIQLGVAAAYTVWGTTFERRRYLEQHAEWYEHAPEPLLPNRRLRWSYEGAHLAVWLGFIAATCFSARGLVQLAGG